MSASQAMCGGMFHNHFHHRHIHLELIHLNPKFNETFYPLMIRAESGFDIARVDA